MKLKEIKNTIEKVVAHVKRNAVTYVIVTAIGYVIYQIAKVICDKGTDKDGNPYYEEFEKPEDKDKEE